MRKYLLKTLQVAPLMWISLTLEVIATSILYSVLSVEGVPESTSLLIAVIALIILILLGQLVLSKFLPARNYEHKTSKLKTSTQRPILVQSTEQAEALVNTLLLSLEQIKQIQSKQQENTEQLTTRLNQYQEEVDRIRAITIDLYSIQNKQEAGLSLLRQIVDTLEEKGLNKPSHTDIVNDLRSVNAVTVRSGSLISEDSKRANYLLKLLSARQLEILELVSQGYSNKQIAEALTIAPATVKVHLDNILKKLGTTNRSEAVSIFTSYQRTS